MTIYTDENVKYRGVEHIEVYNKYIYNRMKQIKKCVIQ